MDDQKDEQTAPGELKNAQKRAALKKLGRYAAYTAPATLVALGYFAGSGAAAPISLSPPPPPISPPPPPP
jgi:hypothetical protein